jgi:hypothetical protein
LTNKVADNNGIYKKKKHLIRNMPMEFNNLNCRQQK